MDNTARGTLAEFLVAAALGLLDTPRLEWDSYDLQTRTGVTIEVKSAAYIQSWKQDSESAIEFRINRRKKFDPDTGKEVVGPERRWADLYVFCVLEGAEPLNVDRWRFYVLRTAVLDKICPEQKTIRLRPLLNRLRPRECHYRDLCHAIDDLAGSRPGRESLESRLPSW